MAVTVKDLSIKTWCSVNVCLPRWRYSLFTITDQVSSLGSLPTLSFAIPRPGQRALDITASVQNFVSPQNGFAWFWQLGPGGLAQADSIKQCWVAFWWRESCETSEGLMPARGATSHHNQETRTLLASTGCQGPGREERERERDIFHRPVSYNTPSDMLPHVATGKTRLLLYHWNQQGNDLGQIFCHNHGMIHSVNKLPSLHHLKP